MVLQRREEVGRKNLASLQMDIQANKVQEGFRRSGGGLVRHEGETLQSSSASVTQTRRLGLTQGCQLSLSR